MSMPVNSQAGRGSARRDTWLRFQDEKVNGINGQVAGTRRRAPRAESADGIRTSQAMNVRGAVGYRRDAVHMPIPEVMCDRGLGRVRVLGRAGADTGTTLRLPGRHHGAMDSKGASG